LTAGAPVGQGEHHRPPFSSVLFPSWSTGNWWRPTVSRWECVVCWSQRSRASAAVRSAVLSAVL